MVSDSFSTAAVTQALECSPQHVITALFYNSLRPVIAFMKITYNQSIWCLIKKPNKQFPANLMGFWRQPLFYAGEAANNIHFISFQLMQLRHARRLSKTRSVRSGKWPKCSQCSGSHGACVHVCGVARGGSARRPFEVSVSSVSRVQRSFLTCLSIGVVPAERRAKMCWRLRAWRPLACCRVEYSLEADRHCRAVSTRHSSSLDFYSILFGWGLHHRVSPACQPPLHSSTSEFNSDQHRTVGFVLDVCSRFVCYGWNITDVKLNIQAWSDGFPPT